MTVVAMDVSAEPGDGVGEQLVRQWAARARAGGVEVTAAGGVRTRPVPRLAALLCGIAVLNWFQPRPVCAQAPGAPPLAPTSRLDGHVTHLAAPARPVGPRRGPQPLALALLPARSPPESEGMCSEGIEPPTNPVYTCRSTAELTARARTDF